MLLNLLTITAFVGIASAEYYEPKVDIYGHQEYGPAYYIPHHRRRHPDDWWRRSSSSSESDEKWDCARLGVFNVTEAALAAVTTAPKIAYYTEQGKEKAIAVCEGQQIESLIGQSRDANVPAGVTDPAYKDVAFLSLSTRAGLTFKCNKRHGRYEAFNLITRKTIPIDALACLSLPQAEQTAILSSVGSLIAMF